MSQSRVKKQIKIYINGDATQIAQDLANAFGDSKVSLANGANRNLIGNHWFASHARVAIDENLHRRSSLASSIAFILNDGCNAKSRAPDALEQTIRRYGGKVVYLQ